MMEGYSMLERTEMDRIEQKVEALLSTYQYRPEVNDYVEIVDFARRQGFEVGKSYLPKTEDGFILIQPDNAEGNGNAFGPRTIGVNASRDIPFNRFVVAHELGHFALHWQGEELYLHRDTKREKTPEEQRQEAEADYFAAALLMPKKSFSRRYAEMKGRGLSDVCGRLSRIYDVPMDSVLRRMEELKLVVCE